MKAKLSSMDKKGGVVTNTIMGVGGLVVGVIIIYVIVSTILGANLFDGARDSTIDYNETKTVSTVAGGTTFGQSALAGSSCSVTIVRNETTGEQINSGNYTVDAEKCTILATAGSIYNGSSWNITSLSTYDSDEEKSADRLNTNLTSGIDNVSSKIPTILLIVAVVFLFGALVLLMRNAKAIGVGTSGSL